VEEPERSPAWVALLRRILFLVAVFLVVAAVSIAAGLLISRMTDG
jgi:hypothetical protein